MSKRALYSTITSIIRSAIVCALASAQLCSLGFSQTSTTPPTATRGPQALTLIASSLKALTGSVTVHDVTLQATASYVAGSDEETGTATLTATSKQESFVQFNLSGGTRQEIRNGVLGAWSGSDGAAHCMATPNCRTDASWFFPALTLEVISADPSLAVSYLGPDSSKGAPLLHLQVARAQSADTASASAEILRLSTMDIYFAPQSFLPLVLDFNVHPDNNGNTNLPVEIQFGNFQSTSGVLAPLRIQKLLQGTLTLDLTVTSVLLNSGVPDGQFALACAPGGQL
jgi:hypothetical protein